MHLVHVQLERVETPADLATLADRADAVQRLDNLGHIDATAGELNTTSAGGWQARVNDGEPFPVHDFALSPSGDGGQAVLNLVLPVGALSVGAPSATQQPAQALAPPNMPRVWGAEGTPDPRTNIPGFERERLGGQVAENARHTHREEPLRFQPASGPTGAKA
ncbi:hypothetical protein Ade02nite_19780 [Paractinoplanes deccanensis]|uniref:Uncharacterized protein n=1 Tax=Paractinoplanes deccanensis TaxID=113561 RepID=A0ABQ3Y009_9ACTN|nr:hypothetical protein [Actinoplanes deccanensis]GID73337.1 hypothetical protein Ade02nite_19780 [Actinoplanes deccanensis]